MALGKSLAGFEWNGDDTRLNQAWSVVCGGRPLGNCDGCAIDAVLEAGIHRSESRAFKTLLPAGSYVAEITACCAQLSSVGDYTGLVNIQYLEEDSNNDLFATKIAFPNFGTYAQESDAEAAYVGLTASFTHSGGEVRLWIPDTSGVAIDNSGSVRVCIRDSSCFDVQEITSTDLTDAIYVYHTEIIPQNLIGFIKPFSGPISSVDNYGYGTGMSEPKGPNLTYGPELDSYTTYAFFYEGSDGLNFYLINGHTDGMNDVEISAQVFGGAAPSVKVSDDTGELVDSGGAIFDGSWTNSSDADGGVIGPFDGDDGTWVIRVNFKDLGDIRRVFGSSNGISTLEIAMDSGGLGTDLAGNLILFTKIQSGCQMSYSQIDWLERGRQTGASCSAVVEYDGTMYIVVKRSIGIDTTCGGGESLNNACVANYLASGEGHPAIAWPTINGKDFLGKPTSGFHSFVADEDLSDALIEKIQDGDVIGNVTGDPAANIPFIIFPAQM